MKTTNHVVEIHMADGVRATEYPTKKAAHAAGMAARRAGQVAYVFPSGSPFRATKPAN